MKWTIIAMFLPISAGQSYLPSYWLMVGHIPMAFLYFLRIAKRLSNSL
jgi:hypothetical protein